MFSLPIRDGTHEQYLSKFLRQEINTYLCKYAYDNDVHLYYYVNFFYHFFIIVSLILFSYLLIIYISSYYTLTNNAVTNSRYKMNR